MKKNVKDYGIEEWIGMIRCQEERATFFKHHPVVDNDLPAKDLHRKPDNYFKHPVKQTLKFFVNISNADQLLISGRGIEVENIKR